VEGERNGMVAWKVVIKGNKKGVRRIGRGVRGERERNWVVGCSDAGGSGKVMGIGGAIWEGDKKLR